MSVQSQEAATVLSPPFKMSPEVEKACQAFKAAKDVPGQFPEPMVFNPTKHQQTFIILHGRGSTAAKFGPPLLETATLSGEKLHSAFPNAKIIFPTASRNRAVIYKKSLTHQWFDRWHPDKPLERQDLMRAGLHKSCEYMHKLLKQEIELVGAKNVVLWGLSQGCATSLSTLLSWDGEPFAAVIGMCGYLPYANHIEDITTMQDRSNHSEDEEDPFSCSDDEDENENDNVFESLPKSDAATQAVEFFREEIDMDDKTGVAFRQVPVFLGHGSNDEMVPIELGRTAKRCLELVGADVKMVEYKGLGHWYSEEMIGDIFAFLREKLSIEN